MLDTNIQVKTENFDGPLALLLALIQKEEMDVRSLDLTTITKQYLDYLAHMQDLNFDVAGDYLYLASTLLLLKSKNCVTEEDLSRLKDQIGVDGDLHITSQAELIRRLEELQHFQKMGELLWNLPKKGHEIFTRPKINRQEIINSMLVPMDLQKLTESMMDFLFKQKRKYTVVRRDRLSIKEKLVFLKNNLQKGTETDLDTLIEKDGGKNTDNVVITFISLLELARLKMLEIFQNEDRSTIYVKVTQNLQDFDIESARGFEEEGENAGPTPEELELQALIDAELANQNESIQIVEMADEIETEEDISLELQEEVFDADTATDNDEDTHNTLH